MDATADYLWIVILSGIVCMGLAWGIGAIDIATSLASGIGAKAFTLKQGVFIILIFEFSGAALLGGKVTETVRTKITDYHSFDGEEDLLMLGYTTSLISATIWLFTASRWEIPISSAHSIIGGIVGFTVVAKGWNAVVWDLLGYIMIFWIVSPALTSAVSIAFFVPMRSYLLRREDSWEHTLRTWPIFVFIVVWIGAIFLFLEIEPMEHAMWQSMLTAVGISVLFYFCLIRTNLLQTYCEKAVAADQKREDEKSKLKLRKSAYILSHEETENEEAETENIEADKVDSNPVSGNVQIERHETDTTTTMRKKLSISTLEVDVHDDLGGIEEQIHRAAEKFDPRVEKAFSILQLASASLDNFAHGSNDVANSIAPLAAIVSLYENSRIVDHEKVPFWMIAGLIAGMIVGLATRGYRIIKSLGVKMTCLTNTRGYGTELSSAVVVIFASYFGFPASSAHVQTGAIVGTGIAEKVGNPDCKLKWGHLINWGLLVEMFAGWILTIICCAVMSGALFALLAYSPYAGSTCH